MRGPLVPVTDEDLTYLEDGTTFGLTTFHLVAEGRGSRYNLYVMADTAMNVLVVSLVNFGRCHTIPLDLRPWGHWDYWGDKLNLRPIDAQAVTLMINRLMRRLSGPDHELIEPEPHLNPKD